MMNTRRRPQQLVYAAAGVGSLLVIAFLLSWFGFGNQQFGPQPTHKGKPLSGSQSILISDNENPNSPFGVIEGQLLFQGEERKWPPNGRGMSDVVVYLKGILPEQTGHSTATEQSSTSSKDEASSSDKPERVVLDQIDMTFVPHVVMMQQGGSIELRNSDSALHNVNGFAKMNQPFNVALSSGAATEFVLQRHEFIRVACNFHPKMSAWIAVMPNRFFTRADEQGRFTLSDIPPGKYQLAGWHENVYPPHVPRRVSMDVTVEPGRKTVVELNFP